MKWYISLCCVRCSCCTHSHGGLKTVLLTKRNFSRAPLLMSFISPHAPAMSSIFLFYLFIFFDTPDSHFYTIRFIWIFIAEKKYYFCQWIWVGLALMIIMNNNRTNLPNLPSLHIYTLHLWWRSVVAPEKLRNGLIKVQLGRNLFIQR